MTADIAPALQLLSDELLRRLPDAALSIDLYGSATLDDFRPGWSDIDVLILTGRDLTLEEGRSLVTLRQKMMEDRPDIPHLRAIEGGIVPADALLTGRESPVVYWGTSGQRIKAHHDLSAIEYWQLQHQAVHLTGPDRRAMLPVPSADALRRAVAQHLRAIREHGRGSSDLYAFGWLLDIARGLYTAQTAQIAAKTAAGEWALRQGLCPDADALRLALCVRRDPSLIAANEVRAAAAMLTPAIQRFADVLENAL